MSIVYLERILIIKVNGMARFKTTTREELINAIIDKALKHVVFEGWSDQSFRNVCQELKLSEHKARKMFPRGGVDLALAFHKRDDENFLLIFQSSKANQPNLRIRDRIESAINHRLEIASKNKEAVKRSVSLFTTPFYFSDGTRALWNTSDKIWISIGDESEDINWYSKRLILSSVYSASLVFWLEDSSENFVDTRDFVNRRIRDVMAIERFKSIVKKSSFWTDFARKFETRTCDIVKNKENFPGWSN